MTNRSRIGKAISWSAVELLVPSCFSIVVLIVLARILSPADFGLMAMLALFIALGTLLIDSGFSQALIRGQNATHVDESTIFFFSIGMGAVIALVLCLVSPWIAAFYDQPLLQYLVLWMALNLFLNSFGTIHSTLLTKELNFRTQAMASTLASIISGVTAIALASLGFGVWSLVGQALVHTLSSVILLWIMHPWRPAWVFSYATIKEYFGFGGYLLWSGLLNAFYKNLYALLIGKLHSVADAGYYSQARRFQEIPVRVLTGIVGRVSFPVFAEIADNKTRLAAGLAKANGAITFVTLPMMLGLMLLARPLVVVLFGEKWLPMVPVLEALAIAGMVSPLSQMNLNVLKAQGYAALNARIQLIRLGIAISLLIISSPFGIIAVAYGQALASIMALAVNTYYTGKHLGYGGLRQLLDVLPTIAACVPMGLVMWLLDRAMVGTTVLELLIIIPAAAATYILVCWLARLDALTEARALLKLR